MHYCLCKNVVVNFEKERIVFLKGIWEVVPLEINRKDYKSSWTKINDLFHQLVSSQQSIEISSGETDELIQLFKRLEKFNILFAPTIAFDIKYIVCNKKTYDFIKINVENYKLLGQALFVDIDEFENFDLKDADHFLVICDDCSLLKLRRLNEKLIVEQKKFYLVILKRDFLHIFFHNSINSPCFECYYETIINQSENENYLDFLKFKDIGEQTQVGNDQNARLNYALAYFYLLLTNNHYFENERNNHKLISFYFPTLEMNIINLWKQANCAVCNQQSSCRCKLLFKP